MKTPTLRQLIVSLADVQRVHLASALLESGSARQSRERHEAYRIGTILHVLRFELSAREPVDRRSTEATCRADRYIEHLLDNFFDTRELGGINAHPKPRHRVTASWLRPSRGGGDAAPAVGSWRRAPLASLDGTQRATPARPPRDNDA